MRGYRSYSGYRVGASHVAKNIGCEDYAENYDDENVSIAVISDGHGDKNCFRSAQGAKIACNVSIKCVRALTEDFPGALEVLKSSPDRVITEIEKEIIREWHKEVEKDLSENTITEEELTGTSDDVKEAIRAGYNPHTIYGCTLIMGVFMEGFWFGIHIGDGKCVVAMDNGLYMQPIPWDEAGCVGNRSTSICNSNAFSEFRYKYGEELPTGFFAASDGVDESFDESGLNRCYYTLGYWIQTLQKDEIDSRMEELLEQISNNGSGDDVSISCIVSESSEIKKPYASSGQVAEKLNELIGSIESRENQFTELMNSRNETIEEIEKKKIELENLKRKIKICEDLIADKEQEIINIDGNIRQVASQLLDDITQLPKAKETKKRIDDYWRANGVSVTNDEDFDHIPKYSEEYLKNKIAASEPKDIETNDIEPKDIETNNKEGKTVWRLWNRKRN